MSRNKKARPAQIRALKEETGKRARGAANIASREQAARQAKGAPPPELTQESSMTNSTLYEFTLTPTHRTESRRIPGLPDKETVLRVQLRTPGAQVHVSYAALDEGTASLKGEVQGMLVTVKAGTWADLEVTLEGDVSAHIVIAHVVGSVAEVSNLYAQLRKNITARAELRAFMVNQWAMVPETARDSNLSALWDRYAKHWQGVMPAHQTRMSRFAAKVDAGESANADDTAAVHAAVADLDRDVAHETAFSEALSARVKALGLDGVSGFTCKYFHYMTDMDKRDGSRPAYVKVFNGDSLMAVVKEPDQLNQVNAIAAGLFGKPAPKEHRDLQVFLDIKSGGDASLKTFLATQFKERTFRFLPEAGWTWTDDPNGAVEMPWTVP
jgi:hypothetical protein